jgi:hypothetical protein
MNINKTILLRAKRGTYVYACDTDVREYLSTHIIPHKSNLNIEKIRNRRIDEKHFKDSVPFYNLQATASNFNGLQTIEANNWIELPEYIQFSDGYFTCTVLGELINMIRSNDSICFFKKNRDSLRNERIVLHN